jgi:undecaprenyl-diphosphatase
MDRIEALNRALFLQINAPEGASSWIVHLAVALADDLVYLIPVLLLALWLWGDDARRRLAIEACLAALLGVGVNQLIAIVWQHPRPFMIGLGRTLIPHAPDSSFPSDHMVVFCSVGLVLLLGGELRLGSATWIAGLLVAWARIFLGVHFPLDMLGSVMVAAACCVIVAPAWRRAGTRVTGLAERVYRKLAARPIRSGWVRR